MTLRPQPELHPVFEALGYVAGYLLYQRARNRSGDVLGDDILGDDRRWLIIAAAAVGALVGSRVLGILEQVPVTRITWASLVAPGGKTVVGGLLGGWIAVEIAKRLRHIDARTGDLFAVPLCVGIAVGRIGCFFAGLADGTYGSPTSVPWGVDFGDGIPRHPTQLYEIVFLLGLAWLLSRWGRQPHEPGILFRAFLAAYLLWRLGIDFLKPQPQIAGMNMIQWACVAGLIALGASELMFQREARGVRPH